MAITFRHVRNNISQGDYAILAFDSAADNNAQDPASQMYAAMIGRTISLTIDPRGRTGNVKGFDELIDAVMKDVPDGPEKANLKKNLVGNLVQGLGQFQGAYPDKPVSKGDSWEVTMDLPVPTEEVWEIKQTGTLKDVQNGVATVAFSVTLKNKGANGTAATDPAGVGDLDMTIDGTSLTDIATGMDGSATMTLKASMTVPADGYDVNMTLNGTATVTITKGTYTAPK